MHLSATIHKTALVTGATGFVGSHIVRRLLADGWNVHVIALPVDNFALLRNVLDSITVHTHDGSTGNMHTIIDKAKPVIAFHLASIFIAQHEQKDISPLITSNVLFGTQIVDALAANGCFRFINTGTSWQHFENRDFSPVNLYAATKQAFDDILQFYVEATPMKAITLKLYDTYGPGDPRPKLFTLLRKTAAEQQALAMSPGDQLIDLVYIDDVVEAFVQAALRLLENQVHQNEAYAVSSGAAIPLRELVELYGRVINKKLPIEWGGRPYRPREVMTPWSAGRTLPGWRPKIGLEEGIKRMETISE
jgi:nucleoside-diphosphate-sugar epimerase